MIYDIIYHPDAIMSAVRITPEEPELGLSWHEIRVRYRIEHGIHDPYSVWSAVLERMRDWTIETYGPSDIWGNWVYQDWGWTANFIFLRKESAMHFKLRWA